jgi:hypothetical protein
MWLSGIWDKVKESLEYAWSKENPDKWDIEQNGYITGRQHHTLDTELFGPNSWLTGYYLAALKAASEMAEHLGYGEDARLYREIFMKGSKWTEQNLFNGEHYIQQIDLKDRAFIEQYCKRKKDARFYWSNEAKEVKYQYGEGSEIDQISAQWHANIIGLGDIFDKDNRATAIKSLYKSNFKRMRDLANPCRVFATDGEEGLIICNWEAGEEKPVIPMPYSEEVMCGYEYAAACTMIQEGCLKEGLDVVSAIRGRYDGAKRNPWSEIECGASYARSMASYSLLLAFSGFRFDMTRKMIGFNPIIKTDDYNTFWSLGEAWGEFKKAHDGYEFTVLYNKITLREFILPPEVVAREVWIGNTRIAFSLYRGKIILDRNYQLEKGAAVFFRCIRERRAVPRK